MATRRSKVPLAKRPEQLRAAAGLTVLELANRLRTPPHNVFHLEQTELRLWDVDGVREYVEALGYRLEIIAVAKDGSREVLAKTHSEVTKRVLCWMCRRKGCGAIFEADTPRHFCDECKEDQEERDAEMAERSRRSRSAKRRRAGQATTGKPVAAKRGRAGASTKAKPVAKRGQRAAARGNVARA